MYVLIAFTACRSLPDSRRCLHLMLRKTCRPIGACASVAQWSASGQFPLASALCSLGHTLHPIGVVRVEDQAYKARRVGELLALCHPHRTPATVSLAGPTTLPFFPPSPGAERADFEKQRT